MTRETSPCSQLARQAEPRLVFWGTGLLPRRQSLDHHSVSLVVFCRRVLNVLYQNRYSKIMKFFLMVHLTVIHVENNLKIVMPIVFISGGVSILKSSFSGWSESWFLCLHPSNAIVTAQT